MSFFPANSAVDESANGRCWIFRRWKHTSSHSSEVSGRAVGVDLSCLLWLKEFSSWKLEERIRTNFNVMVVNLQQTRNIYLRLPQVHHRNDDVFASSHVVINIRSRLLVWQLCTVCLQWVIIVDFSSWKSTFFSGTCIPGSELGGVHVCCYSLNESGAVSWKGEASLCFVD